MIRSRFMKVVWSLTTAASLQLGQLDAANAFPSHAEGRTILVRENGVRLKCTVLKIWQLDDGTGAMLVESIDSGEKMTILENGHVAGSSNRIAARVYHWGKGKTTCPDGVPAAPMDAAAGQLAAKPPSTAEKKKLVVLPGKEPKGIPVIVEISPAKPNSTCKVPQVTGKPGVSSALSCPADKNNLPEISGKTPTDDQTHRHANLPRILGDHSNNPPSKSMQVAQADPAKTSYAKTPYAQPVWNQVGQSEKEAPASVAVPAPVSAPAPISTTTPAAPAVNKSIDLPVKESKPAKKTPEAVLNLNNHDPMPVKEAVQKQKVPVEKTSTPPADWRESWGKLDDSTPPATGNAEKKARNKSGQLSKRAPAEDATPRPGGDPLMDPEAFTKRPAKEILNQKVEKLTLDSQSNVTLAKEKAEAAAAIKPTPNAAKAQPVTDMDLPPDDFKVEPTEVKTPAVTQALKPAVKEETPKIEITTASPKSDLEIVRQKPTPEPLAFSITEPTPRVESHKNKPVIMAPSGSQSMMFVAPNREEPTLTALPFEDKDKVASWLKVLHASTYPSQREWAADQLSACDWHKHLDIVPMMILAAQEDPAASVRAGCIRSLARMKADTVPVVMAIHAMKKDADPRVQTEVMQALAILAPDVPLDKESTEADTKKPATPKERANADHKGATKEMLDLKPVKEKESYIDVTPVSDGAK